MQMNPKKRTTVKDDTRLPPTHGGYVRSASCPRFLTHPFTGENFLREDGAPWKQCGYRVDKNGNVVAVGPCGSKDGKASAADPAIPVVAAFYKKQRQAVGVPA